MRFLHTMFRVRDLDAALAFWCTHLGLVEVRRKESEKGRFTLVFLSTPDPDDDAMLELTWNWDEKEAYDTGRFFGHVAFEVDDLYATCARLQDAGITVNRPPRDGHMAFVKSPDGQPVELLQKGDPLPIREPWAGMPSTGTW